MSDAAVRIDHLRKTFGSGAGTTVAVEDLSLEIARGGSLAIVGESGSGKSTTARCLLGLERPSSGHIEVAGRARGLRSPNARERRRRASEIQMVFQDPYGSLNPRLTGYATLRQAISLALGTRPRSDQAARIRELLDLVELPESLASSRPRQLSGGQRQRLAIARALAAEPEVLVLDEAISALDVSVQAQILNLLADIRRSRDVTLLFISHDLAAVRQISDDIVVMRRGAVVESGATERVISQPEHPYTRRLLESVPRPGWDPMAAALPETAVIAEKAEVPEKGGSST